MAIYPPYIDSKLPAQVGDTLSIPYEFNRANISTSFKCKIKTISTNLIIGNLTTSNISNNIAIFNLGSVALTSGQYYKIQLADAENSNNYYSTVGVFKYIGEKPTIELSADTNGYNFIATYTHPNEKLYSYRFDLYNGENLCETSGELIYDAATNNTEMTAYIQYCPKYIYNNRITCKFIGKTINNYDIEIVSSKELEITVSSNTAGNIIETNIDNGYNKINISQSGQLVRRLIDSNYWTILVSSNIGEFNDYFIESGLQYEYGILNSNTINLIEGSVMNNYEDMFLNDGNRQLKIKFNPKISSFKNTVLENKIDTIGHKYPFFFRNAQVSYKEFTISGLISYLTDEENLFMDNGNNIESTRDKTPSETSLINTIFSTDLSIENINKEKKFRFEVLNWLNNSKPKVFKSATEGLYIIRLMNISLTPNDTLGRMLYTFNATAYEIADFTYENLVKYKLINTSVNNITPTILSLKTYDSINLLDIQDEGEYYFPNYINYGRFIDAFNSNFILIFESGVKTQISVGSTGYYELPEMVEGERLIGIQVINLVISPDYTPTFEFEYSKDSNAEYAVSTLSMDDTSATFQTINGPAAINFEDLKISYLALQVIDDTKDCTYIINKETTFDLTSIRRVVWTANEKEYLPFTHLSIGDGLKADYYFE